MKNNTTNLFIFSVLAFSLQFMSCKKDNNINVTTINANSVGSSLSSSSLDSGLVAWYTFDSDVLDHSGNNNNVIFNNANPAKGQSNLLNTAYSFDGSTSYMRIANSASLNPQSITLYAIIKVEGFYQGTCHGNRIINKGFSDNINGRYALGFDDQFYYHYQGCNRRVRAQFENFYGTFGDGQATASGVTDTNLYIIPDKWYSIAYTFENPHSKLYINGNLQANAHKARTTFSPTTYDVFIGKNSDPTFPYYFKGVIDEIRIYNRALSKEEIKQLYKQRN